MKKTLLFISALFLSTISIGQTEIEPFAPSVPGTYIGGFTSVGTLTSVTSVTTWTSEGTATGPYVFVGDNGATLFGFTGSIGNYCAAGIDIGQEETLVSPPIDFGVYTDNPTLEFRWGQSQLHGLLGAGGYSEQQLEVMYREGASGSWVSLTTITTLTAGLTWNDETIDLSGASDFSELYIGFRVSWEAAGLYPGIVDYGQTVIDEIVITGEEACVNTANAITESTCFSYTVPSGDESYTVSGMVMDTIPNAAGCDSVLTIDLTITTPDVGVTVAGFTLSSTATGVTYQWMDCSDSSLVAGATSADFMATQDGSYAVIIDDGGCIDTSACSSIAGIGLSDIEGTSFNLFPNPANDMVTLQFENYNEVLEVTIFSSDGRVVYSTNNLNSSMLEIDLIGLEKGFYTVSTTFAEHRKNKVLIKQ